MGVHANIGADKFPKQGHYLGQRVMVCFNYDSSREFPATCIRDDMELPGMTIFRLDDGRVVLATECQHGIPSQFAAGSQSE
jgi:hypothetical protein